MKKPNKYYPLRVITEIFDNSLEIYVTRILSNGKQHKTTLFLDLGFLKDNPQRAIEWLLKSVDMAFIRRQAMIDGQIK